MLSEQEKQRRLALLNQQLKPTTPVATPKVDLTAPLQQFKIGNTNVRVQPVTAPKITPVIKTNTVQNMSPLQRMFTPVKLPSVVAPVSKLPQQAQQQFATPIQETVNKNFEQMKQARLNVQTGRGTEQQFQQAAKRFTLGVESAKNVQNSVDVVKKDLPSFINDYNTMDDQGQRAVRDKLTNLYQTYSSAQNPELKALSDKAGGYLSTLTTPKDQLPEYLKSLPDVQGKTSFGGFLGNLGKSTAEWASGLTTRVLNAATTAPSAVFNANGLNPNDNAYNKIADEFKAGTITQEERDKAFSALNNKLATSTGTLTGESKGLWDRFLRSAGTAADAAMLVFNPTSALTAKTTTLVGEKLLPLVLKDSSIMSALGAASSFEATGADTLPTDILASALMAGGFQGLTTGLTGLITKTVERIKAKPFAELTESERALLQREGQTHPSQTEPTAPQVTKTPFKNETEISQINRIIENKDTVGNGQKIADYYRTAKGEDWSVQKMSPDEYLQRAAKAMGMKTQSEIDNWISQPMGNPSKYAEDMAKGDKFPMAWINEVAGSQEGRTRALAAKQLGYKEIPVAIAEKYIPGQPVVPIQAAATEQAMVDATAQPTAAITSPEAPQQPQVSQAEPTAIQGAQAPTAVPGTTNFVDFAKQEAQRALDEQTRYAQPLVQRGLRKLREIVDPRQAAVRSDRLLNKELELQGSRLLASNSLEQAIIQSERARNIANNFVAEGKIGDIIRKYSDTPENNRDFNTYRVLKRDIEQIQDGRAPILQNLSLEQKQNMVKQYEQAHPQAKMDVQELSKSVQAVQDLTTTGPSAFVAKEDLKTARTKKDGTPYSYWTPIQRALPEDVERAQMNAFNVGTLGRQKVLQDFTSSEAPTINSFEPITDYVTTIFRQMGQSKVSKIIADRAKSGQIEGAKILYTGEQSARLKTLQKSITELNNNMKTLEKPIIRLKGKATAAKKELSTAEQKSVTRTKQILRDTIGRDASAEATGARAAIDTMSKQDLLDIFKIYAEPDIHITPNTQRIYSTLVNKNANYKTIVEALQNSRMEFESLSNLKKNIRQDIVELRPDPVTGKQTILGLDTNGNQFRVELPPEYAALLQGLNKQELNGFFKAARIIQSPFRQAWVGILNPAFQLSTAVWNAVWAPIVSKEGYRLFGKDAVKAGLTSILKTTDFQKALTANGAISFGGDLRMITSDNIAEAIGAHATGASKFKWFTDMEQGKGIRRSWKAMNEWGGKIDQATRMSAATSAYNRSLKANMTKEQALGEAVFAWNNVLPDFSNISSAVKVIDSIIPFTGASVAGTRQTLRAIRERPAATLGKMSVLTAAMTAVYAYNLSSKTGEEFYKDMIDSKKQYVLDNNLIIVLPGASKDKTTGEWSGILKIPFPPEARPINTAIRTGFLDNGSGVPIGQFALSTADFLTGKLRDSSSPMMQVYATMITGKDPRTGRDIWDQTMNEGEKYTAVKNYLTRNLGIPGAMVNGKGWDSFISSFVDRVYGAKGSTPAGMYSLNQDKAIKETNLNTNELNAYYGTVAPQSKDLSGNVIKDKTYYDSANKASTWLRYPKTFEVSKKIDTLSRTQGNPGDPLFDLPPEQLKVVLHMQANYSPSNFEDKAILKLNPWLTNFNKKRSEYFDKILTEDAKKAGGIDPMGLTIPRATPEIQSKIDESVNLTGQEKAQFYANNPEISQYFQAQNDYTRAKRAFMGLPQFDDYPTPPKEVQTYMDQYSALPKQNGPLKKDGTPSSPDRSAWIQSHPNEWAMMTDQWNKQSIYNLQREGATAVYEGINMSDKTLAKLGISQQGYNNMPYVEKQYLSGLLSNVKTPTAIEAPTLKKIGKVKIYKPSVPRRTARIRLQ